MTPSQSPLSPTPLLGFVACSGVGKTTLLTQLIPLLKERGIRVAVIKHAHHRFDIDHEGKDSYRFRKSGADQIVIAAGHRMAWIREFPQPTEEPDLKQAIAALDNEELDLILVEGFKFESYPKIEIRRTGVDCEPLYPADENIVAVVSDKKPGELDVPWVDLNRVDEIAEFVEGWLGACK